MTPILAAAAVAVAPTPAPPTAEAIEIVTRAPVGGTLQQGVQAYRPEFFTAVRPGTALDMVQWLPGFTFEDVRDVRGLGAAVGNVLIDGQPPTSKTDTLATVLRRIPAGQVERVDIVVGGAPGIDMRGRSVIANVVLKKTTMLKGTVTAQATALSRVRVAPELAASLSRATGSRTVEASLTLTRRAVCCGGVGEGELVRTDPQGRILFEAASLIDGWASFATGTGAFEFPAAGGKLRLNAAFTHIDGQAAEATTADGARTLYATRLDERYGQGETGLRYTRAFGRATVEAQLLQRINAHESVNATIRPPVVTGLAVNDTLSESIARISWRFKRDDTLSMELSAEGALNDLDTRSDYVEDGVPKTLPSGDVDIAETRADVGGLVTWKPRPSHTLTVALRAETSTLSSARDVVLERDFTYVKPRLVYAWTVDPKTQLRLRLEREVSQVAFGDFVASLEVATGLVRSGNPDLRPRSAWVGEAVLERQFWTGASLVLTARRLAIRDVVDYRILPELGGAVAVANIGDGRQTDLIAAVTLPLKRLGLDGMSFKGGLTWRRSRVVDPVTGAERRIGGQSPVVADAHFIHDLPAWKLTWGVDATYTGRFVRPRPTTVETFDEWLKLGAFVERRFGPRLTARIEGTNLLNPKPLWQVANYAGPRATAPLLYTDARRNTDGRAVMLRLRRTLN